jgi:hypothetical protein
MKRNKRNTDLPRRFSWQYPAKRRARARRPKFPRSKLPKCGARTRHRVPCDTCGTIGIANRTCSCGAAMPVRLCQAKPLRDFVTGEPLNGRCPMHGGWSSGPTTDEGRARALANLELGRKPRTKEIPI